MTKKILIIEDNEDDQIAIQRCLNQAGFENLSFLESAEESMSFIKKNLPDIVVTDTKLPQKDGFEVCREIKQDAEIDAKVIIMTGSTGSVDVGKAREMGADEYCVKTSDYHLLLDALKKLTGED